MAAPIKADVIYYATASDFEFEFNLCGCCTMRLLSDKPKDSSAFVRSLSRAVSRSQIVFAVGNAEGENAVLPDLCTAIGYPLKEVDLSAFSIAEKVMLPEGAIPLVSSDGVLGGCVIECGPQAIIVLFEDRDLRRTICRELVYGYIRELANNINKTPAAATEQNTDTDAPEENISDGAADIDDNYIINSPDEITDFTDLEEQFLDEEKPKKGKKALKRFLVFLFVVLFLGIGLLAYMFFAEPLVIKKLYKEYSDMYGSAHQSDDGIIDALGELYDFNQDTVGFLKIDGTNIKYPIVTEINKGAGYYKNHIYNGWYSLMYGTPYVTGDITAQTYYRNIVIYGKDAHGGVMFANLDDITTVEGYRTSPTVKFDTLYGGDTYKIFAAFTCDGKVESEMLKTSFFDDSEFSDHLKLLLENSSIKTTVDVKASDEILTLIAYGKNDTVVVARKLRAGESSLVDTQNAKQNDGNMKVADIDDPRAPIAGLQPMGTVPYSEFSSVYEQSAPLSPEKAAEFAAAFKKATAESSDTSSAVSSEVAVTADNALELIGNKIITVYDTVTEQKITGSTYDILCRMVEAEMGSSYEAEALKAQAIASYGWLITNGAASGESPAVRLKTASSTVCNAVKEVIGLKPYFGTDVAQTMYFPCSAGYTANCAALYLYSFPYLADGDSSVDRNSISFASHRAYSADKVREWILEETGIDLSAVGDKSRWFNVTYDRYGAYAESVVFGNTSTFYSGRYLRECVFTAERVGKENTLNSAAYKITYQSESDTFIFETRGIGHGIGMSQYGANHYAKAGMSYIEILEHYFDGITVSY